MARQKIDILFLSTFQAPFIEEDLDILSNNFHVRHLKGHGIRHAVKIAFAVFRSDIVFCWFASVYSAVAVMVARTFGLKSVIVLGGVDIACNEELGYGIWLSGWKSKLVRYAIRHADRILISDLTMKRQAVHLADYPGDNIVLLPAGFDMQFWKPMGQKDPHILTVAAVNGLRTLRVKGIDILIEAARQLPQLSFVVVGVNQEIVVQYNPPSNMTFHPLLPRKELCSHYQRARFYCQPSREEAFGYALREAMLCGCIPIASDVGGMPTAVSGSGVLVPAGNAEQLVAGILTAMNMNTGVAEKARSHVVALYPKGKRAVELVHLIESFIQ